jgi:tRNA A-37 threonylcarbamoyl transferase component Bud32
MTEVYIGSKRVRLDPSQSVGKGGEADVYRLDATTVVKIFKQPDHPDYMNNSREAEGARHRLQEHQTKLREFPKLAGMNVKAPISLVTDRTEQRILGYTMEFVPKSEVLMRWSERSFRGATLDNNKVIEIFQNLRATVEHLHLEKVVIGDFNDLNVLVDSAQTPFLIDADSFQFGKYLSRMYTERFVDPLHCDPNESRPILKFPHKEDSDWYAWNVMLFRSLLLCDPFGGIYRPSNRNQQIPHTARPLLGRRISVFHKDVIYPKPAVPYDRLPDGLLDWFKNVFVGPHREVSKHLLANVRWTACSGCGTEHARPKCPSCQKAAPAAIKETIQVRGKVTSTTVFKTSGEILFAVSQSGLLNYLFREGRDFKREDGTVAFKEDAGFRARYRIMGDYTLIGNDDQVRIVLEDSPQDYASINVDRYGQLPVFDANESFYVWCENGVLYRKRPIGPERIGEVLQNQTLFWVGEFFGFGFYRAANLSVAFVFDVQDGRLNDTVKLPPLRGHLMDSTTFFTKERVWFFATLKQGPKIVTRCTVIDKFGDIEGHLEEDAGTGILGEIRGKCAFGKYLFMVTDEGLCRLEVVGGTIQKTAEYPDAEPFVNSGCHLFPATNGLHVVDRNEIRVLKMG